MKMQHKIGMLYINIKYHGEDGYRYRCTAFFETNNRRKFDKNKGTYVLTARSLPYFITSDKD